MAGHFREGGGGAVAKQGTVNTVPGKEAGNLSDGDNDGLPRARQANLPHPLRQCPPSKSS